MPIAKKRGSRPRKGSSVGKLERAKKKLFGTKPERAKKSKADAKAVQDRLEQERATGIRRGRR